MIIRNRLALKAISLLLVLVILQPILTPNFVSAQVSAPTQMEYTNFEDSGSTDMVNLLTGDFSYKLDLIEVPGPEGSFTAPLFYQAGIGLEQEASWVGLGWNINVGSITRSIAGYPDDANGETQIINVQDPGIRGWSSSLLGLAYLGIGNIGWNTQVGHYGQISLLGLSWADGKVDFNPVMLGLTVMSVMLTAGAGASALQTVAATITGIGPGFASMPALLQVASIASKGMSIASNMASYQSSPDLPDGSGDIQYSKKVKNKFFFTEYKIWLDYTRYEEMYGVLYMQNAKTTPVTNTAIAVDLDVKINSNDQQIKRFEYENYRGPACDIGYNLKEDVTFTNDKSPAVIATDNFKVNANGISGAISPYRLESGTISIPRRINSAHLRYSILDYLNYKVPFVYENSSSNNYYHHVGAQSSVDQPSFYTNISTESIGNVGAPSKELLKLNDITYNSNNRIRSDINNAKAIPTENYINWLSNGEITASTSVLPGGFMDYFAPNDRIPFRKVLPTDKFKLSFITGTKNLSTGFLKLPLSALEMFAIGDQIKIIITSWGVARSEIDGDGKTTKYETKHNYTVQVLGKNTSTNNSGINISLSGINSSLLSKDIDVEVFSTGSPLNSSLIGGFSITNSSGLTYHFSIPVYDYENYSRTEQISDASKFSEIIRRNPYATSWLLTAITGPDFVDRGGVNNSGNGIVDENDWGYWVKMNYGRLDKDIKWRAPYANNDFRVDNVDKTKSFMEGFKQVYYLNSIETRSHIGLFLKSSRDKDGIFNSGQKALKLDEFVLLSKENYARLQLPFEHRNKIEHILYSSSLTTTMKAFINLNADKIVAFNYTNDLCKGGAPGTINNEGKLTLKSVSILGKKREKLFPDYLFDYDFNPLYNKNYWDGWGFYNSNGTASGYSHTSSAKSIDPSAYSLTKVTTPTGNELKIVYEPDTYSSVSGITLNKDKSFAMQYYPGLPYYIPVNFLDLPSSNFYKFKVGDIVKLQGQYIMTCDGQNLVIPINKVTTINGVSATNFRVNFSDPIVTHTCSQFGSQYQLQCTIEKYVPEKRGGGLRVKELSIVDNNTVQSKIRYVYSQSELDVNSLSSGVVSKEPEFIKDQNQTYPTNIDVPGYPVTPVIYGKVAVKSGLFHNENDFHTMQVYEFETPHHDMISLSTQILKDNVNFGHLYLDEAYTYYDNWYIYHNKITDKTSKIGVLKKLSVYANSQSLNNIPKLVSETINEYVENVPNIQSKGYQGVYSQGNLGYDVIAGGNVNDHKVSKLTYLKYPTFLKSVTTINDGITSKKNHNFVDFFTSRLLDYTVIQPNGTSFRTITQPAYHLAEYSELGSKAINVNNKNQLNADAATYTYLTTQLGQKIGLLSASATTFIKDFNTRRDYNSVEGLFKDITQSAGIWRVDKEYVWIGDKTLINPNGTFTFSANNEFKLGANVSNQGWKLIKAIKRVNTSTLPIEIKDYQDKSSLVILGYNERVPIAQVANAELGEATFSSAEDLNFSSGFFGGEVSKGNGIVKSLFNGDLVTSGLPNKPHTGDKLLELNNVSQNGFVYRSNNFKGNKKYKAAVWTNSLEGRLYYKSGSNPLVISGAPDYKLKCGDWYLLEFTFITPTVPGTMEVGVTVNTNQTVWFDDFKVQPFESSMTCNVYPSPDFYFIDDENLETYDYVLSNDHLYTKSVYSVRNKVEKVFVESFKYKGEKLVSESKEYFRRSQ